MSNLLSITSAHLLTPASLLQLFGLRSYPELVHDPVFRSLMRTAPEHHQSVAWSYLLPRLADDELLTPDQWYALLDLFLASPETFDLRTVADSAEFFCPESWLRLRLIAEVNAWLDSKDNLPFLRSKTTNQDTARRMASWLTAGGVRRPIFHKGNGKYHEQFQQAVARACLRGMRHGQYEALVIDNDRAHALYPLTVDPSPSLTERWPYINILGAERAVHGMVQKFGLHNLAGILDVERGAATSDATVEKPSGKYALTPDVRAARLRAAAQFHAFAHVARAAIYAPEWIETHRALVVNDPDLAASAIAPGARDRLDERRLYFTEFAYARAHIQLCPTTRHVRDTYEAWADADTNEFSALPIEPGTNLKRPFAQLRRAMLDRFPDLSPSAASSAPDVTVVDAQHALKFLSAVTLLWYFVWVSPRLQRAEVRQAFDSIATTLYHAEGFDTEADIHAAETFLHARLSGPDTDLSTLPMQRLGVPSRT